MDLMDIIKANEEQDRKQRIRTHKEELKKANKEGKLYLSRIIDI